MISIKHVRVPCTDSRRKHVSCCDLMLRNPFFAENNSLTSDMLRGPLSPCCLVSNVWLEMWRHIFIPGKQWLLFDLYGKASQFLSKRYFSGRDTTQGNLTFYLVCFTDEITLYYWHRISVPTLIVPFFYVCLHCFLYFHTENLSYFLWGSRQFDFTRFLPHEISVSDSLIFIHLSGVFKDSELEARYKKCGLVGQQQKPVGFVCSLLI